MEENDQNEVGEGLQAQGVAKRQDWVKEMRAKSTYREQTEPTRARS
jgi:hypothetical protein